MRWLSTAPARAMRVPPAPSGRSHPLPCSLTGTSFLSSDTMTMVVVRLSRMDDMKNVIPATSHSSTRASPVAMSRVTTLNPWCASTVSTMVMAPSRKKMTWLTSPSCDSRPSRTSAPPVGSVTARTVQSMAAITRATPALLKARVSSKIMPA